MPKVPCLTPFWMSKTQLRVWLMAMYSYMSVELNNVHPSYLWTAFKQTELTLLENAYPCSMVVRWLQAHGYDVHLQQRLPRLQTQKYSAFSHTIIKSSLLLTQYE